MSDRFYSPELPAKGRVTLEGDEARHLSRVRRLGAGDRVELFDGRGYATCAEVLDIGRDRVELVVVGEPLADRIARCRLTLATAVPKGERFDWLVEKATELGVDRLVPIVCDRSAVDPREAKVERLRRRVVEACKQCGRNALMELEHPTSWISFLTREREGARLLADPGGLSFPDWPRARQRGAATLAIGPEGGFSLPEVEEARTRGWQTVSLGETLLRIETAGVAASAAILALCEG